MKCVLAILLLGAALAPATTARAATAGLSFSRATGYQIAVAGAGWNPQATITFSLVKGDTVQSIDLRPESDGSFAVGLNNVNICGVTFYRAHDTAGKGAGLGGPGVMCVRGYVPPAPGTAVLAAIKGQSASASTPTTPPRTVVKSYFADLNAHHYIQAHRLEATCAARVSIPAANGRGTTTVRLPSARPNSVETFVRSARVTSIHRFRTPTLDRLHFAGFHVLGTFQFAASPSASNGKAARAALPSGHRRLTIIARRCAGQWMIDPGWDQSHPLPWD